MKNISGLLTAIVFIIFFATVASCTQPQVVSEEVSADSVSVVDSVSVADSVHVVKPGV